MEGINVHRYGAHIFHTNNKAVWQYVNQFAEFNRYTNSPVATITARSTTCLQYEHLQQDVGRRDPAEAKAKIEQQRAEAGITEPKNLEEQAISLVGTDIYEKLIKGYTGKQWGRPCTELPAFIIKRPAGPLYLRQQLILTRCIRHPPMAAIPLWWKRCWRHRGAAERGLSGRPGEPERTGRQGRLYRPGGCYFGYRLGALQYRSVRFETEVLDTDNYQATRW